MKAEVQTKKGKLEFESLLGQAGFQRMLELHHPTGEKFIMDETGATGVGGSTVWGFESPSPPSASSLVVIG